MDDSQYCLKWNSFSNNFVDVCDELYNTEFMADAALFCEGKMIRVHRVVLSACSNYFRDMFYNTRHFLALQPLIFITGIKYEALKKLIEFMYKGEVHVNQESLQELLKSAEDLKVKGLSDIKQEDHDESFPCNSPDESAAKSPPAKKRRRENTKKKLLSVPDPLGLAEQSKDATTIKIEPGCEGEAGAASDYSEDEGLYIAEPAVDECDIEESKHDPNQDGSSVYPEIKLKEYNGIEEDVEGDTGAMQVAVELGVNQMFPQVVSALSTNEPHEDVAIPIVPPLLVHKIPRPPNAFMVFANEWRKKLAEQHPSESNKDISVRLGNIWKCLPQNLKEKYYIMASEVAEEHKKKYPFYVYNPKEARIRKALRNQHRIVMDNSRPLSDNQKNADAARSAIVDASRTLEGHPASGVSNSNQ